MKRITLVLVLLILGLSFSAPVAQAVWTSAKRLTWNSGFSENPAIAVDSTNAIHVVWEDDLTGNREIYYKKSTDGGTTWSAALRLTWTSGFSENPAIAIDSTDAIHVVWDDLTTGNWEVYYKKSANGGATWSAAKRLTYTSGSSMHPSVAIDSGNTIRLVWDESTPGNLEVYYKRSADGGTTWGAAQRLTWTLGTSQFPTIATSSPNTVHIAWYDSTPGLDEIYYKRSTDGGATWSALQRLTWTPGGSYDPVVAADSVNGIHVVWQDDTPGNNEVYYKRSTNGGATWGTVQRLTYTSGVSYLPVIATDSLNAIHVIWRDNLSGNQELYYKKSTDGGATWSAPERLTWTSGASDNPAMAIDSTNIIHVVWEDDTPFILEVYYKSGN